MSRYARFTLVSCFVLVLAGFGCASSRTYEKAPWYYPHSRLGNLSESPEEHAHRVGLVAARDRKALFEDLDILFQTDRPSRLTRWHDR